MLKKARVKTKPGVEMTFLVVTVSYFYVFAHLIYDEND